MRKLFFVLFGVFALAVMTIFSALEKSGSSPPAQNFITIADDVMPSLSKMLAMTFNNPTQEGCVLGREIINMASSQTALTDIALATREGCVLENDACVEMQNLTARTSFMRSERYNILKYPFKIEGIGVKVFYA